VKAGFKIAADMAKPQISPTENGLLFEYDEGHQDQTLTALAGIPLVVQTFRSLGVPASIKENLFLKQRQRGYDEATYIESFVVLNAAGGDCLDDFAVLRKDRGLACLIGHELPSPEAARKFLYQFHDEEKLNAAQKQLSETVSSCVPEESFELKGLHRVNRDLIAEMGRRCADQRIATIDLDSTIIESDKKQARKTYEGSTGYQPMLALWAEMNMIVADEFRDGNVPAHKDPVRVAKRAFAALPAGVQEFYFRGDSACYEGELLEWLQNQDRPDGPQGRIGFAISMRMNDTVREKIARLPQEAWQPYAEESAATRECAELWSHHPGWVQDTPEDGDRVRVLAIRIRMRQGGLFDDGHVVKHFAVVTNMQGNVRRVLEWHREKAGSIEAAHDVIKNELASDVMPCGRFGANAAWLRLSVISYNVLSALKRLALPPELMTARPKRLRFLILNTAGRIVQHARKMVCRIAAEGWRAWLQSLPIPNPAQ
jgi:hypothetical protein